MKMILFLAGGFAFPALLGAQPQQVLSPPVIDVHMHAPLGSVPPETVRTRAVVRLAALDSLNVRVAVLTGVPDVLRVWMDAAPDRLLPALLFPCENGRAP